MMLKISAVSVMGIVIAVLLPACIAEVDDPDPTPTTEAAGTPDEDVAEAEQAVCGPGFPSVCTGWDSGGRRCLANCAGSNYWMDTGYAYWGTDSCYHPALSRSTSIPPWQHRRILEGSKSEEESDRVLFLMGPVDKRTGAREKKVT